MVSMCIALDRFSQVVMIFVFDSWCMYCFCGALTSVFTAFLCVFGYFCFLLVFILLYVLLLFLFDIKPGSFKIALISHEIQKKSVKYQYFSLITYLKQFNSLLIFLKRFRLILLCFSKELG